MLQNVSKERLIRVILVILIAAPIGIIGVLSANASTVTVEEPEAVESFSAAEGQQSVPGDDEHSLPAYTDGQDPGTMAH